MRALPFDARVSSKSLPFRGNGRGVGRALRLGLPLSLFVGGGVLGAGCQKDADERLGLDEKKVAAWDPTSLADGDELEKALLLTAARVEKKLGAHRQKQQATYTLGDGDSKATLDETWLFEEDGNGGLHALHENSHGSGMESYVLGGPTAQKVFVRPRYGRFVRRDPEIDEVDRIVTEQENVLGGFLSVFGRFCERKDGGAVQALGRPAHKVVLSLKSSPSRLRDKEQPHQWRKAMQVSALAGEVVVDDASGVPLHAVLNVSYSAPRNPEKGEAAPKEDAPRIPATIAYKSDAEAGADVAALSPPPDYVPNLTRPRPIADRQMLLDGLVAPSGPGTSVDSKPVGAAAK